MLEQRPSRVEQRQVPSEMPLPSCNGLGSPPVHGKRPGLPGSGLGTYDCDVRVEWAPLYSSKLADSAGLCFLDPAIRGSCGHGVSPLNDCLTARQIAVIGSFPTLLVRRARLQKFPKRPARISDRPAARAVKSCRSDQRRRRILAETASTRSAKPDRKIERASDIGPLLSEGVRYRKSCLERFAIIGYRMQGLSTITG